MDGEKWSGREKEGKLVEYKSGGKKEKKFKKASRLRKWGEKRE